MSLGRLKKDEKEVLNFALEFYIRLGLGQLSEIATRLDLLLIKHKDKAALADLHDLLGKAEDKLGTWKLQDECVSRYTLVALLLQARLNNDQAAIVWVEQRLKTCKDNLLE